MGNVQILFNLRDLIPNSDIHMEINTVGRSLNSVLLKEVIPHFKQSNLDTGKKRVIIHLLLIQNGIKKLIIQKKMENGDLIVQQFMVKPNSVIIGKSQ